MSAVRRFFVSAWLSYRALFTWLNPYGFVSTMIVFPVVLTLLFGAMGRFAGTGAARPVVGGSLLAAATASLYGLTLAVSNERDFGTLEIRVATPEGLLSSLLLLSSERRALFRNRSVPSRRDSLALGPM